MKACGNKKAPFEVLQINITDSLRHVWQRPDDFCGNILLFIQNGGFRSYPPVKGNHLAVKAFARPLIHGLTCFDDKFDGLVELVIDDGLLSKVVFSEQYDNTSQSDKYQHAFLTHYPLWEVEEVSRMQAQGMANRLHGEMRSSMTIDEKLDWRMEHLKPVEVTLIVWAFREITGVNGHTGKITVRTRNGGIMSTTPTMSPSANRKKLAMALEPILPQVGIAESDFYLNRGLLNPK